MQHTHIHTRALLLIGLIIAPGVGLKVLSDKQKQEEERAMLAVRQVAGEEEEEEEESN